MGAAGGIFLVAVNGLPIAEGAVNTTDGEGLVALKALCLFFSYILWQTPLQLHTLVYGCCGQVVDGGEARLIHCHVNGFGRVLFSIGQCHDRFHGQHVGCIDGRTVDEGEGLVGQIVHIVAYHTLCQFVGHIEVYGGRTGRGISYVLHVYLCCEFLARSDGGSGFHLHQHVVLGGIADVDIVEIDGRHHVTGETLKVDIDVGILSQR